MCSNDSTELQSSQSTGMQDYFVVYAYTTFQISYPKTWCSLDPFSFYHFIYASLPPPCWSFLGDQILMSDSYLHLYKETHTHRHTPRNIWSKRSSEQLIHPHMAITFISFHSSFTAYQVTVKQHSEAKVGWQQACSRQCKVQGTCLRFLLTALTDIV